MYACIYSHFAPATPHQPVTIGRKKVRERKKRKREKKIKPGESIDHEQHAIIRKRNKTCLEKGKESKVKKAYMRND